MTSIIHGFYSAFQKQDAEAMATYYHDSIEFEDPAFGELNYDQTCAMWRMLVEAGKDLEISFKNAWSENEFGGTDWEAITLSERQAEKSTIVLMPNFNSKTD